MRRVVVTGMGIVSCLGNDPATVVESLRLGRSGIRFKEDYAEVGLRSQVAGVVDVDIDAAIDRRQRRFMSDAAAYAYLSMQQAIADSGLTPEQVSDLHRLAQIFSGGFESGDTLLWSVTVP